MAAIQKAAWLITRRNSTTKICSAAHASLGLTDELAGQGEYVMQETGKIAQSAAST